MALAEKYVSSQNCDVSLDWGIQIEHEHNMFQDLHYDKIVNLHCKLLRHNCLTENLQYICCHTQKNVYNLPKIHYTIYAKLISRVKCYV